MRPVLGVALALALAAPAGAQMPRRDAPAGWRCGEKTHCARMTSCAEAMVRFHVCGLARLAGESDVMPCERLCGQGSRPGSTRRR